tara:strand:- start:1 stop:195 length:195 start_codon:yes stop_codon:yes gene_type:complete
MAQLNSKITVQLKKSTISEVPSARATVNGLGLKRLGQEVTLENTPAVRGMIKKVLHLVSVIEEK